MQVHSMSVLNHEHIAKKGRHITTTMLKCSQNTHRLNYFCTEKEYENVTWQERNPHCSTNDQIQYSSHSCCVAIVLTELRIQLDGNQEQERHSNLHWQRQRNGA